MKRELNILLIVLVLLTVLGCSKDDEAGSSSSDPIVVDPIGDSVSLDFVETLGGSKNDSAQAIEATQDGGYVILGYTQSTDGDITDKQEEGYDFYLLKFNSSSILQWSKTYGGTGNDRGFDVLENTDGSFVVLGYSTSSDGDATINEGAKDYWVLKLSSSGAIIWQKSFGFLGADYGTAIIKSSEGGYLLTGTLDVTASEGEGNTARIASSAHAGGDYWAIKITENGDLEWSKYFGGGLSEEAKDVIQTDDGGYIIIGDSDSADVDITGNKGSYDFWVTKISRLGILEWEKSFGGTEIDRGSSIVKASDGNYLIIGSVRSNDLDVSIDKGAGDLWVIKISPSGDLISEKSFGGSQFDTAEKIINSSDGGYIIAGASRSEDGDVTANEDQNDGWVIKIDSNGDLEWQVSAGGSNIDFLYDVAELNDGTVIAVGDTYSADGAIQENKGLSDILTMKIK